MISQKNFQNITESSPEIKKELEGHLFKRLLQSQQLLYSFLKNNPQQHYPANTSNTINIG